MKKFVLFITVLIIFFVGSYLLKKNFETSKAKTFDKINVCFIADNKYVKHTIVVLYSIMKNNNSNSKYNFYILTDGLNKKNENLLKKYVKYKSQQIEIISLDKSLYEKNGKYGRSFLEPIMLSNLWIGSKIPQTEERCLYLDSDTLVVTDLSKLYNTNLGRNIVGMVKDPVTITEPYENGKDYYNAGVMLIDLKKWRVEQIEEKSIALLCDDKYMQTTIFKNQDIFNKLLKGRIKNLDYRYNFFVDLRYKDIEDPYIIHYIGLKPWRKTSDWLPPEAVKKIRKSPKYELYNKYEKELNVELKKLGY